MFKKLIPIFPQIIASLFLTGFMVFAWTEPGTAPPGGNVDTPLNTGLTGQTKSSWLASLKGIFLGSGPSQDEQNAMNIPDALSLFRTNGGAILNTGGASNGLVVQQGNVIFGPPSGFGIDSYTKLL